MLIVLRRFRVTRPTLPPHGTGCQRYRLASPPAAMSLRPCTRLTSERPRQEQVMAADVKGQASYFPSIERTYGRPIEDWLELFRPRHAEKHMDTVAWLKVEDRQRVGE